MNPKCLGGDFPDTFSARSVHLTGLKMRRITRAGSFNYLVGACEQYRWNVDAERPGGLQVDDEIELGGPQDRQVGRLRALENVAGIDASLEILVPISSIRSSSARRLPPTRVRDRLMVPRVARQA